MKQLARPARVLLNYVGQLRAYSYVDLLLLFAALGASVTQVTSRSLLWFGFLIFLEWGHRDRGRERWSPWIWVAFWAGGLVASFSIWSVLFVLACILYTLKKRIPGIGGVSFVLNGALKALLVAGLPGLTPTLVAVIFALMGARNLAGDFRDVTRDRGEGVRTLPVRIGVRQDHPLVYPACLGITSVIWAYLGQLPFALLLAAVLVELVTYRLTPR